MTRLGIFAKYSAPGSVKTRLADSIGAGPAAEVYRAFVETLLNRLGKIADEQVLAFTPAKHADDFRVLAGEAWLCRPQAEGDLGKRMQDFFESAFADGATRVVLIGSDSPTLPREFIEQAFQSLKTYDVVLGPSADGGYYLVGARRRVPPIFSGLPWGTSGVLVQTLERLDNAGWNYNLLPAWYDVDTFDDLNTLHDELSKVHDDPAWRDLFHEVKRALACATA